MATKSIKSRTTAEEEAKRKLVIELARNEVLVEEGELEIDDNAIVSFGDDNGAFVQAWLWVDFAGTELDQLSNNESLQP